MPPPIPLPGSGDWYSVGSQAGSASSSAKRGRSVSQACSGDDAAPIVDRTSATNERTTAVSRRNSLLTPSFCAMRARLWPVAGVEA